MGLLSAQGGWGCGGAETLLSVLLLRPWTKEDSESVKRHTSMSCWRLSMQPVVSLDHIWSAQFAVINFLSAKCEKMGKEAEDKDVLASKTMEL